MSPLQRRYNNKMCCSLYVHTVNNDNSTVAIIIKQGQRPRRA